MGVIEGEVRDIVLDSNTLEEKSSLFISALREKSPFTFELKILSTLRNLANNDFSGLFGFDLVDYVIQNLLPPANLWPKKTDKINEMLRAVEPKINLLIDGVFEIIEGDELADKHELQKRRLSHLESFSEELSSILDQDPDIYKAMIKKLDKNLAWEIVNRYDFDEKEIWEYILKINPSHQPNL